MRRRPRAPAHALLAALFLLLALASMACAENPPTGGASDRGQPRTYRYPVIAPRRDPPGLWCRGAGNPSCGRDPWWMEFEEAPLPGLCQFAFLPPGFVSSCALIEAIVAVDDWPEGHALLQDAAAWGVTARIAPQSQVGGRGVIAHYDLSARTVRVGDQWHRVSTWALAAVLVHEFTHARDHKLGRSLQAGVSGCLRTEFPAYLNQAAYAAWMAARMGSWPPADRVARELSAEDNDLYHTLGGLVTTPNVTGLVARHCNAVNQ